MGQFSAGANSSEFALLRTEMSEAGRNVQAIKVRPVKDSPDFDFEIVFGHRRHRACLELGLQVFAIVADLSDQELFGEMERENRLRANLSPYEQGTIYARALEVGLYPSGRQMATSLVFGIATVSQAMQLANLPDEVVAAFSSPLDLQFRWAPILVGALGSDRAGVLARARRLSGSAVNRQGKLVLAKILATVVPGFDGRKLMVGNKAAGSIGRGANGSLIIKIKAGYLSPGAEAELLGLLERSLRPS